MAWNSSGVTGAEDFREFGQREAQAECLLRKANAINRRWGVGTIAAIRSR